MRLRELQEKNVINMKNCKCLGNVVDLDLDEKDGCIRALILPGPGHFFGIFCREYELFIPWCDVKSRISCKALFSEGETVQRVV